MIVLAKIGEMGPKRGWIFPSFLVPTAPIRVARLPKIMSGKIPPDNILPIKQPIKTPGMAAEEKMGRSHRIEIKTVV